MSNKTAAIAAAEALGGILCWTLGSACGWRINVACNHWAVNVLYGLSCVALETAGLLLFTRARYRRGKWMGYWQGRRDEAREHTEFMMKVFKVGQGGSEGR